MGKQLELKLQRQDSSFHFQSSHPGCLWAVLHLLDYHRWHNVKNMLPHKRNGRLRHPKGNGSSETVLKDHDAAQVPQYFNKEAQIFLVEPESKDIVVPNKKLGKFVVTAKETAGKGKTAPAKPSRQKIAKNSAKFQDKTAKKSEQYLGKEFQTDKRELRQVNLIDKDISDFLMKEPVDIMEMFKLNKKLFAEMLRGGELGPNKPFRSRNSNTKVGLTKSMSFPVVDPSGLRIHGPSKLEHKQNESFPKGKKIRPATPASKPTRNLHEKSLPVDKSGGSPPDVKQQGWNQLVVNRFNAIKQKVKQAFKDRRKGYSKLSVKETPESSDHLLMAEDGIIDINSIDETNDKESCNIGGTVRSTKKTSFSIETLDRYKHLFAKSFPDNTKYHHSRSLTLASGTKIRKNRLASRSFNRNLSSPDLGLFCSFFHDVSHDSSQTDEPIINSLNRVTSSRTETDRNSVTTTVITEERKLLSILNAELANRTLEELDHAEEFALVASEIRIDEQDELVEDEFTSAILEINPSHDLLPDCNLNDEMEFSESNKVLDDEPCSPDHRTSSPELPITEGMECQSIPKDEQMVSNGQPLLSSSDSITAFRNVVVSHENAAMTDNIFDEQVKDAESNGIENAYYYHVRDIFEVSGLIESELAGTCRSELGKEIGTELDEQLVFDLVNEALLDINGTSSTYFHKAFSFNCRILPPPSGDRLLKAVWKRIGPHLSSGLEPQLGQSLEDVVAGDLANRDDGWIKLQLEAEFLALDVEDLIIDQLLGELMCS